MTKVEKLAEHWVAMRVAQKGLKMAEQLVVRKVEQKAGLRAKNLAE